MGFPNKLLAGFDSALRQGAGMLSRATRGAADAIYDDSQDSEGRRDFFRQIAAVGGGALLTAAVLRGGMQERDSSPAEQSPEVCSPNHKPVEFEYGELMQNWVRSFEVVWGGLDKNQIVFVDQLGNVIDDPITLDPIRLSENKAIPAFDEDGSFSQIWLDWHRASLVRKYPTIFHKPGTFPELHNLRTVLLAQKPGTTLLDLAWKNAQDEVFYKKSKKDPGIKMSRLNFSQQVFSWSKVLPKDFQEIVSLGIPSVESIFRDEAVSEDRAVGAFQMLEGAAADAGLFIGYRKFPDHEKFQELKREQEAKRLKAKKTHKKFKSKKIPMPMKRVFIDERKFFVSAAFGSMRHFESLYQKLLNFKPLLSICSRFQLQPSELLYPCVINSYNSGGPRVHKMLTWFDKNFSAEDVKNEIGAGPYGMDVFAFMTRNFHESGIDKRYGRRSLRYPIQVMAMANLMKNRLADQNFEIDPFSREDPYEAPPEVEEILTAETPKQDQPKHAFLNAMVPLGAGVAVGTAAGFALDQIARNELMTRRKALMNLTASVAGAIAGTVGVDLLASKEPVPSLPKKLPPSVIVQPQHMEKQQRTQSFAELLLSLDHLISNREFRGVNLPRRQQTKTNEFIASARPQFFDDFTEVKTAANRGRLTVLEEKSPDYRLYNLGTQLKKADGADASNLLRCVYPHTKNLLQAIDAEVNELLHKEAGLDPRFKVRLVVTSAIRPNNYNERLRPRSSAKSAHQYGIAADIANTRFDLIDTQTGASYAATENACDPINKKFRVTVFCRAALYRVIKKMHDEGKIIAMLEGGHVHFTDKQFRS